MRVDIAKNNRMPWFVLSNLCSPPFCVLTNQCSLYIRGRNRGLYLWTRTPTTVTYCSRVLNSICPSLPTQSINQQQYSLPTQPWFPWQVLLRWVGSFAFVSLSLYLETRFAFWPSLLEVRRVVGLRVLLAYFSFLEQITFYDKVEVSLGGKPWIFKRKYGQCGYNARFSMWVLMHVSCEDLVTKVGWYIRGKKQTVHSPGKLVSGTI